MRVKIVKNTLFFAIFLYFLGSHSQCHSWFDFEHSDWLRAEFFAWVTFFSDWYLGEFWSDWDKQYLFSEQNFAGNSLKVVSKWLEQNIKTTICDCTTASHWSICRPALFFLWYFLLNHSIFKKKRVIHIISSFVF